MGGRGSTLGAHDKQATLDNKDDLADERGSTAAQTSCRLNSRELSTCHTHGSTCGAAVHAAVGRDSSDYHIIDSSSAHVPYLPLQVLSFSLCCDGSTHSMTLQLAASGILGAAVAPSGSVGDRTEGWAEEDKVEEDATEGWAGWRGKGEGKMLLKVQARFLRRKGGLGNSSDKYS